MDPIHSLKAKFFFPFFVSEYYEKGHHFLQKGEVFTLTQYFTGSREF